MGFKAVRTVRRWPYRKADCTRCAAELVYDQRHDIDPQGRIQCPECGQLFPVPAPLPEPRWPEGCGPQPARVAHERQRGD